MHSINVRQEYLLILCEYFCNAQNYIIPMLRDVLSAHVWKKKLVEPFAGLPAKETDVQTANA